MVREQPGRSEHRSPQPPPPDQRLEVVTVDGTHPSVLSETVLLGQCEMRTQRRSGPGGQHRNKTSSGVFLQHLPTQIVAEATERRSQADNRAVAVERLRFRLAVEIRTVSAMDGPPSDAEMVVREKYRSSGLRVSDRNHDKPAVLALVLNDLHASGGQPSLVSPRWGTTTSSIVRFVKSHPPAFLLLASIRQHHGRGPLK